MSCNAGGADILPMKRKYDLVSPAALDCPLCRLPLCPPVFQCRNGHISCSKCCPRIGQGCHSCTLSTGNIRCLAIENVLKFVEVSCKHACRGCREKLKHSEIFDHETRLCQYSVAYQCPVSDCGHHMPMTKMLDHITYMHGGWNFMALSTPIMKFSITLGMGWKKFKVITGSLKNEAASFLLHFEERKDFGVQFFCTSMGASKVNYNLKVMPRDGSATSYILETTAPFLQKRGDFSACSVRQFLLIPTDIKPQLCKFDVELSFPENRR